MSKPGKAPPELVLEHPKDERTDFLLQLEQLRAQGKAELAERIEKAELARRTWLANRRRATS